MIEFSHVASCLSSFCEQWMVVVTRYSTVQDSPNRFEQWMVVVTRYSTDQDYPKIPSFRALLNSLFEIKN